jgi:hypothetical protein
VQATTTTKTEDKKMTKIQKRMKAEAPKHEAKLVKAIAQAIIDRDAKAQEAAEFELDLLPQFYGCFYATPTPLTIEYKIKTILANHYAAEVRAIRQSTLSPSAKAELRI